MEQDVVAAGYDAVYRRLPGSATFRRLWHQHAEGPDFPEEFGHASLTTLPELRRMSTELRLQPTSILVDLGCGLAGPALWVARETGARLVGIDLSQAASEHAAARAARLGLGDRCRFHVGPMAATGLDSGSIDGVMSEDALQYVPDKQAVMEEVARILRPGGRLVFTAYELDPERVRDLGVWGVDPVSDYGEPLTAAGFRVETYEEAPGWPEPMSLSVVLPGAARGLTTGALLAVARAAGETAPLLFTAFGNRFWQSGLNSPIAALPLQIYRYGISPYADWQAQAWAASFVLVMLVLLLSVITRFVVLRGAGRS